MSFCTKCGTELKEDAKFCPSCGAPAEPKAEPLRKSSPSKIPNSRIHISRILRLILRRSLTNLPIQRTEPPSLIRRIYRQTRFTQFCHI